MRPRSGFTLLEVLVALAVLGMLLVLIGQGMAFGLRAAATQAQQEFAGNADLPTVEAALRGVIANADPGIYPEPATLAGSATSVSLVTTLPGPDGTSQRVDAVIFAQDGQLRLRWTPHRHIARFGASPPAQEMTLLGSVGALRFSYRAAGSAEWQPGWAGDDLPALVRLQLTMARTTRPWPPILMAPRLEAAGQ